MIETFLQTILSLDFWIHAAIVLCAAGIVFGIISVVLKDKRKSPALMLLAFFGVIVATIAAVLGGKKKG